MFGISGLDSVWSGVTHVSALEEGVLSSSERQRDEWLVIAETGRPLIGDEMNRVIVGQKNAERCWIFIISHPLISVLMFVTDPTGPTDTQLHSMDTNDRVKQTYPDTRP